MYEKEIPKEYESKWNTSTTKQSIGCQNRKMKIYKLLIRPVATQGAQFWTLNKNIAKCLVALENSFKKNVFGN
jgi:hypothetical protein